MSDALYPISLIAAQRVTPFNRVLVDDFENGTTTSRRLWADKNFKRQFVLEHAPLTLQEFKALRSFYTQRNGQHDSFWYRDNITRGGNAKVRFGAALPASNQKAVVQNVASQLDEVAPIRTLPEYDELTAAAGVAPAAWYEGNRQRYFEHLGTAFYEPTLHDHSQAERYPLSFQSGSMTLRDTVAATTSFTQGQYQAIYVTGSNWTKTAATIAELAGAQPGCTLFVILRRPATTTKHVIFAVGAMGAGNAMGLAHDTGADRFMPWLGGSETWTNTLTNNSPADTWRSYAVVFAAGSNNVSMYVNAALIGTDSNTRNFTAGPASLGAAIDGSDVANSYRIAHAIILPAELTLAQVKAVHNLLGYQVGLSIVP